MAQIPFLILPVIAGFDGMEFKMPVSVWHSSWPKTSNDNGLLFLRNTFFAKFYNVSWHSNR
jgi:hypothetical protein